MKKEELYELLGDVDESYVEQARIHKSRRGKWAVWAAVAACLCLSVAGLWYLRKEPSPVLPTQGGEPLDTQGSLMEPLRTSDTYGSLEELLTYLSDNELHMEQNDGSRDTAGTAAQTKQMTQGQRAVAYGGYVYYLGQQRVNIARLDDTISQVETLEVDGDQLFLWDDRLILVDAFISGGDELEPESSVRVQVYGLTDPGAPTLMDEFVQLGELTACGMAEGELILMTSDGVCACGWSRLNDVADYVPRLEHNGAAIPWNDDVIAILGEPTRVHYVAATRIQVQTGTVGERMAFYGDITDVFYGADWLVLVTRSFTETGAEPQELYTFDGLGTAYTGKLQTNTMVDEESVARLYISSVTKSAEVYRMVGRFWDAEYPKLWVGTADMTTGTCQFELYGIAGGCLLGLDDLLWENDRAVITISTTEELEGDFRIQSRLLFADFDGLKITLSDNALTADQVTGVDGLYSYGSPFGKISTMIDMGNGIYLRYNGKPNGLDVFDFSESTAPELLAESQGALTEPWRYEFCWEVYGTDVFGILSLCRTETGSEFAWNIYRVDAQAEQPLTLLAQYELNGGDNVFSSGLAFETFSWDGVFYCVNGSTGEIIRLSWES